MADPAGFAILENVDSPFGDFKCLLDRFGDLRPLLAVNARTGDHQLERGGRREVDLLDVPDPAIDPDAEVAGLDELAEYLVAVHRIEEDRRQDHDALARELLGDRV